MAEFLNTDGVEVQGGTPEDDQFVIVTPSTGSGNDTFVGYGGANFVEGGDGNDVL